jgi:hypothetical protein
MVMEGVERLLTKLEIVTIKAVVTMKGKIHTQALNKGGRKGAVYIFPKPWRT